MPDAPDQTRPDLGLTLAAQKPATSLGRPMYPGGWPMELRSVGNERFREPGATIRSCSGETFEAIQILLTGRAYSATSDREDRRLMISDFHEPGTAFGLDRFLPDSVDSQEEIIAHGNAKILSVPNLAFMNFATRGPSSMAHANAEEVRFMVNQAVQRQLGRDRTQKNDRLKHMTIRDSKKRILAVLRYLAGRFGTPAAGSLDGTRLLDISLMQKELAAMTNIAPETVCRILPRLQAKGQIFVMGGGSMLIKPEKVR